MIRLFTLSLAITVLITFSACEQSEPPETGRVGDKVFFSGYEWNVKSSTQLQGPGPNFFSNAQSDIYVDESGYVHLHISKRGDTWYSTELVSSENMGYGTYSFTIEGDFVNMPENIVVGLFTWDNDTFFEQANSEVDVELSKWGETNKTNTLQYAVQPVAFSTYFPERVANPEGTEWALIGVSTHIFHWTDTLITCRSYAGEEEIEANLISTWEFDLDNPARVKEEGGNSSQPIIIPAPGVTTNARLNFWRLPWVDDSNISDDRQELIIRAFDYIPV